MKQAEKKSYRVIWNGGWQNITTGDKVFVGKCSGVTVFGEFGTFIGATASHLIFRTESKGTIKTSKENLFKVSGKFGENGWFVSLNTDRVEGKDYIHSDAQYWDSKVLCYKNK